MRKLLLISLLACILSPSIQAQVRYFEWIDPKTTLRVKLEPDTHELWKEVKDGVWVESNAVSFDEKIVADLPSDYSVHSAFYTGDSVVTFTLHGMGNVYAYKVNTQTLERLDHSFYKGYNFSSTEFIRQDTLYSFGGYGFWHFNNTQTFFDKKYKEWFLYKSKNKGPETIKGGLQGYDGAKDIFYSGLGLNDPALIGGKRENSKLFYQFDFKTKEWTYLGEVNKDLQLTNTHLEIYWNGRYFIGWSTKELYIIDPSENKIYSNTKIELAFDVAGKLYTKADTLIYYSPNGRIILKHAIKKILEDSDELGPLYTNNIFTSNYMPIGLGVLLLGGLGAYVQVRRSKRKRSNYFTEPEENLLSAFIQSGSLSTQDINEVLGSASKSLDNQRRIRSITIKQINQKLFEAYGVKEGIEKQSDVEDKRLTIYNLQESLAERLKKDGRFV
jgi:hypothetical protein